VVGAAHEVASAVARADDGEADAIVSSEHTGSGESARSGDEVAAGEGVAGV
jgi:hypothetical protein